MGRTEGTPRSPVRREPPRFRPVTVREVEPLTPHLLRVTLAGAELDGLTVTDPAASVRMLLPPSGARELVMPDWNGNEFLLPDGRRPAIRTFTPYRVDPDRLELELWVVLHEDGAASTWAASAAPGDPVAISGPGRGYALELEAPGLVLAGDETAIPAISQLLTALPAAIPTQVYLEVAHPDARLAMPEHPSAVLTWLDLAPGAPPGTALVDAVRRADIDPHARVWAAGEAAAVQRIRRNLFEDRGFPRAQATVRGYWKHGRRGDSSEA